MKPFKDCYSVNPSSTNISFLMRYCRNDFGSRVIYKKTAPGQPGPDVKKLNDIVDH